MDKTKIRAELDKLGVVYNARLGEEKLMEILEKARKKGADVVATPEAVPAVPAAPAPEVVPAAPVAVPPDATATTPGGIVKVVDKYNMVCRTYSLAEHGEGYIELAQSFAAKKGLRIA